MFWEFDTSLSHSPDLCSHSPPPRIPLVTVPSPQSLPSTPFPFSIIFAKRNEYVAVYVELNCAVQVDCSNIDIVVV